MTDNNTPRLITIIPGEKRLPPDTLVNLTWLAHESGMSEKWFYKLIARGEFMPPIKFGRTSRWRAGDYYHWLDQRHQQASDMQTQTLKRHQAQTRNKTGRRRQAQGGTDE